MLNLRCLYCQTPFTVGRVEMLTALISMDEKNQSHHDAHCPRCRRANSISRQRMELFFPNWREAAKQMASAPAPAFEPVKTEPLPRSVKAAVIKTAASKAASAAAAKLPASKRRRASKPASAKPASAQKKTPAAAKSPAKTTSAKVPKAPKTSSKTTTTKKGTKTAPKKK